MGQIVSMDPVATNPPHEAVTKKLDKIAPGNQFVLPQVALNLPTVSWTKNLAILVPVSIVVRINNASNIMAK